MSQAALTEAIEAHNTIMQEMGTKSVAVNQFWQSSRNISNGKTDSTAFDTWLCIFDIAAISKLCVLGGAFETRLVSNKCKELGSLSRVRTGSVTQRVINLVHERMLLA